MFTITHELTMLQERDGWLSEEALRELAARLDVPLHKVESVSTFYTHYRLTPPKPVQIHVCRDLSCFLAGGPEAKAKLEAAVADRDDVEIHEVSCLGRCEAAPACHVGHTTVPMADPAPVLAAMEDEHRSPYASAEKKWAADPYADESEHDSTLKTMLAEHDIDSIVSVLEESGLRGMGGAGFPSGRKWSFVRMNAGPRYLAVNGDEGEPGTFKDRYFLEREPHVFLEGMLIAAWAVEAETCFIYMRDEYPAVLEILRREIAALEAAGIVERDFIDLRRGAGAYICGEESAMIESIEGKRGLPRHRPPFVASVGVFNRPTLVHNVETLYWVAKIAREGAGVFGDHGTHGRKGMRSYSISGRVKNPGVKIAPAGTTMQELIDEYCGGMADGHVFKAYQPGGPSAGLLPATMADIPMDFDTLQEHGTLIGSAAIVVLSEADSARGAALNMLKFFEDESCGQCTPCRVGCEKAVKLMQEDVWNQELLEDLSQAMVDASICGLGQAAPNPIRLVMKHFKDEIE